MKKSTEKGYSLIELMVVIAIIGLLYSVAIPQYLQYRQSSIDAVLKNHARNFYITALAYFVDTGAESVTNPPKYGKREKILHDGILFNNKGDISGFVTFSHTESNKIVVLDGHNGSIY